MKFSDAERLRPAVFTVIAMEEPEDSLSPHYVGRVTRALTKFGENSTHIDHCHARAGPTQTHTTRTSPLSATQRRSRDCRAFDRNAF